MDAILISIQPKWVEKILNGEKTIEIRKTMPKCKLPCKVYIYCTKGQELWGDGTGETWKGIDENEDMTLVHELNPTLARLNGKVVAEFTLNKVKEYGYVYSPAMLVQGYFTKKGKELNYSNTCLKLHEIEKYANDGKVLPKPIYAWHIDDLIVYEKPLPLKAFRHCQFKGSIYEGCCDNCHNAHHSYPGWVETREDLYDCQIESTCCNYLKKPPQSWCYVHELEVAHDN